MRRLLAAEKATDSKHAHAPLVEWREARTPLISNLLRVYQNPVAMVQTSGTRAAVKSDQKPIFISDF
jgi:hypothetical protein